MNPDMTFEQAMKRANDLHAIATSRQSDLIALMEQIEKIFPGTRLTLVARDPEVPIAKGSCIACLSRDNLNLVITALMEKQAGLSMVRRVAQSETKEGFAE